jgi:hypothetical protein
MAYRNGDYIQEIEGILKFVPTAKSQQLGNSMDAFKRYSDLVDRFGNNESSVIGYPNIGRGLDGVLYAKAWIGADAIFPLGSTFLSKVGIGQLTNRGTTLANLSINIFPLSKYGAFDTGNSYNRVLNKGGVDSGTPILPQIGECRYIDTVGQDLLADVNAYSTDLNLRWERSIRFTPDSVNPVSEVFILSKGYGDHNTCQYAISYDSTSIYRTVGGSKVAVALTSEYFAINEEVLLTIKNFGDTGTDSFGINDILVRDNLMDGRGAFTTNLTECIGGIRENNLEASASISNALGHYRLFSQYNAERLINPNIALYQQISSYQNYSNSIMVWCIGDSNMNGFGGPASIGDRSKSFIFLVEKKIQDLGFDVIFLNIGVGGTTYDHLQPTDISKSSIDSINAEKNIVFNYSCTKGLRNLQCDLVVSRSGSNDYNSNTESMLPYNYALQLHRMALINAECCKYDVPYICNTTGNNTNPSFNYKLISKEDAAIGLMVRSTGNCVDTHSGVRDPDTLLGYSWAFIDDVHYSLRGCEWVANQYFRPILKYISTSRIAHPETV